MAPSGEQKRVLKHRHKAVVQFSSGAVAGFIEVCVNHPLDVVKTRLQMQSADDPRRYKSIADCFKRMAKSEGFFAIYKGIVPVLVVETPKMALRFMTYEQTKRVLSDYVSLVPNNMISGFFAGAVEGIAVNPFEVVKVRLQTDRQLVKAQPSAYSLAKQIYRTHGLGKDGLSLGLTSNIFRHGVFVMVYFTLYAKFKEKAPKFRNKHEANLYKVGTGLLSGCIGTVFNIPWDVVKSRIQGLQPVPGEVKYKTCWQSFKLVYKEEGFLALYKGLAPKMLRLGTGHALIIVLYEHIVDLLEALASRI